MLMTRRNLLVSAAGFLTALLPVKALAQTSEPKLMFLGRDCVLKYADGSTKTVFTVNG